MPRTFSLSVSSFSSRRQWVLGSVPARKISFREGQPGQGRVPVREQISTSTKPSGRGKGWFS